MFYVYRTNKSVSAEALTQALQATRIGQPDVAGTPFKSGDVIVCWGARIGPVEEGVKTLNNAPLLDKFSQIEVLTAARVPTVVARRELDEWIRRKDEHCDGNDLLHSDLGYFWVKREQIQCEYRIHSFNGVSIRAGVKVPDREDAHPWIRTYKGGWRIDCNMFRSTPGMRTIAHDAVKALRLEFGAVDIGEKENGELIVLEVNRSPGVENENTMKAYASAIKEWEGA